MPFPRVVSLMASPPPFAATNVASMKLSRSSMVPSSRNALASWVRTFAQDLALAPLLESAMDRFVVGIALEQHVPLRAGVQNPEHRFQDVASGHRFAARASIRDVFFGKILSNPFPLIVTQAQHASAL